MEQLPQKPLVDEVRWWLDFSSNLGPKVCCIYTTFEVCLHCNCAAEGFK